VSRLGWLILLLALAASLAVTVLSRGHFMFVAAPLLLGAPLAAWFRRRR
jgi:hypothetical protein